MAYDIITTHHAHYFINLEDHMQVVDSIPLNIKLDCMIVEADPLRQGDMKRFLNFYGHKREFKHKATLYTGDVRVTPRIDNIEEVHSKAAEVLPSVINLLTGVGAGVMSAKNFRKLMSRRAFLGMSALLGGYGLSFVVMDFLKTCGLYDLAMLSDEQKTKLAFKQWWYENSLRYTISIRNAIIAQKAEHCISSLYHHIIGHKPRIGFYYGSAHYHNLKKMLLDKELRTKYLEIALAWQHLLHEPEKYLERICEYIYDGKQYHFKRAFNCPFNVQKQRPEKALQKDKKLFAKIDKKKEDMSRRDFFNRFRGKS